MDKPRLSFWQIWNMSFGFLGIQFGWGLQMANMSAIYEYLGRQARPDPHALARRAPHRPHRAAHHRQHERPHLGPARPPPALLPGRRHPELARPHASCRTRPRSGWRPACSGSSTPRINISMEPFRAFVADLLPEEQRTRGFAMQSLFIGLGAVMASALPWILTNWFGVGRDRAAGAIPADRQALLLRRRGRVPGRGALDHRHHQGVPARGHGGVPAQKARGLGLAGRRPRDPRRDRPRCPSTMRQLALVQMCTWFGLFCMWLYFPVAVARNVFGAPGRDVAALPAGRRVGGALLRDVLAVCFALLLRAARDRGAARPQDHPLALPGLRRPAGLLSVAVIHDIPGCCCCR